MGKRKNVLREKSFDFALKIVKLYQEIVEQRKEYVLSRQVLRSGTSIGGMVREEILFYESK